MARRRLPRAARIGIWSLAGLVGLAVAAGVVAALVFDPDSLKPRIVTAVKQATGRDLTLQGHIRLGLSLQPTLTVQGVSFANPPGFSRPEMATLERLDLKLALIPLLSSRVEIDRLVLVKPDIMLEADAQGHSNWQFTPAPGAAPTQPAASGPQEKTPMRISIAEVRIENGVVTLRQGGQSTVLGLTTLRASAESPESNTRLAMSATYNGAPFTVDGELGSLARLQEPNASTPWPVQATVSAAGAKLSLDGTIAQPMQGRGYALKVAANVPDVAALSPFVPGQTLPALHDVQLGAQIADAGAPLPNISSLTLHVGASDLTGTAAGFKLDKLDVAAARLDQPVRIDGQGSFENAPVKLAGTIGAPAGLLSGDKAPAPIPIDVSLQGFGSSVAMKGTAARAAGGRPSVQGDIASDKLDLDALKAAFGKPPAQEAPAPGAPAAKPATSGRVIPDTPIPFGLLRLADADVKLNVTQLKFGGATYRAIATHLELRDGRLRLDPVSADLPEGHLDAALSADAAQANPAVALRLRIPALALQPVFAAMGQPGYLSGTMNVQADLRGVGESPHAIAGSLDGSLGLSMANGTVDNRLLGSTLGSVLRAVNLLDLVGRGGTSQVQCFALRVDASHGVATVRSLVLVSSLLTMDGGGSMNLGAETLDLRVRPQTKVVGTGIVVPLKITGSFRSPSTTPDAAGAVTQNAGTVAGTVLGSTTPLGAIAGALGGKQLLGGVEVDCGPARGGSGATAPAPQPAPQQQKRPDVGGVLKQLFR
jgi:uncharacterized protein involved in outer membrane biogenesis